MQRPVLFLIICPLLARVWELLLLSEFVYAGGWGFYLVGTNVCVDGGLFFLLSESFFDLHWARSTLLNSIGSISDSFLINNKSIRKSFENFSELLGSGPRWSSPSRSVLHTCRYARYKFCLPFCSTEPPIFQTA